MRVSGSVVYWHDPVSQVQLDALFDRALADGALLSEVRRIAG